MLPMPSRGTFGFQDRSGALVRFDFRGSLEKQARRDLHPDIPLQRRMLSLLELQAGFQDLRLDMHPGLAPGNLRLQLNGSASLPCA